MFIGDLYLICHTQIYWYDCAFLIDRHKFNCKIDPIYYCDLHSLGTPFYDFSVFDISSIM